MQAGGIVTIPCQTVSPPVIHPCADSILRRRGAARGQAGGAPTRRRPSAATLPPCGLLRPRADAAGPGLSEERNTPTYPQGAGSPMRA